MNSPEVAWAKDPANRGRIYQGPVELATAGRPQGTLLHYGHAGI